MPPTPKRNATSARMNLGPVFERLCAVLKKSESATLKGHTEKGLYSLIGPPLGNYKDGMPVAAVRMNKNYVSYHYMPVYAFPDLIKGLSPALCKRMQGKACFNFTTIDEGLFAELAELTPKGFARFARDIDKIPWGQSTRKKTRKQAAIQA